MKVIKPVAVTDAVLISSTAPETDYSAWAAGTAYSVGNLVIRTSTHRIYERLIAGKDIPQRDMRARMRAWTKFKTTHVQ